MSLTGPDVNGSRLVRHRRQAHAAFQALPDSIIVEEVQKQKWHALLARFDEARFVNLPHECGFEFNPSALSPCREDAGVCTVTVARSRAHDEYLRHVTVFISNNHTRRRAQTRIPSWIVNANAHLSIVTSMAGHTFRPLRPCGGSTYVK